MRIVAAGPADHAAWAALRAALWPDEPPAAHLAGLAGADAPVGFLAFEGGEAVGFVEASLRRDHVNGCETSPVAFVEGLYVAPAHRRCGMAAALVAAVAEWARTAGVGELASDALLANAAAHAVHRALGFRETERVVFFRKPL